MNTAVVKAKLRVAHLVSHPIQYFTPLYQSLAQRDDISLKVFFNAGKTLGEYFDSGFNRLIHWNLDLESGYNYYLSAKGKLRTPPTGFDWRLDMGLIVQMIGGNYDAFWLHGYSSLNALVLIAFGVLSNIPVFLRDDANFLTPRSLVRKLVKRMLLPLLFRSVIALHVGVKNQEYFQYYGAKRLYPFCYAVDNDRWRLAYDRFRCSRENMRARFGIEDDEAAILFCGKLISRKGPLLLLEAFDQLRKTSKCHLLFVGDGELRETIEIRIKEKSIPNVYLLGFLDQENLPSAYVSADLLVVPSTEDEPWALVVNEAMNFALPIIASSRVGCAADLVKDGVNGFVVEAGNLESLVTSLAKLIGSPQQRREFGKNSRRLVADYGLERSGRQIMFAIQSELGSLGTRSKPSTA